MKKQLYMNTFILTYPVLHVRIIQAIRHLKYKWSARNKPAPF